MKKKVAIVGAGLAGLTAGIYAASSGFDVTIWEQGAAAGGACTGWKRKGFYFEGALHWLTGSSNQDPINQIWREVGVIDDTVKQSVATVLNTLLGRDEPLLFYTDPDRMAETFHRVSPADAKAIERLRKDIQNFSSMLMPLANVKGVKMAQKTPSFRPQMGKMLGALMRMPAINKMNAQQYSDAFSHPGIQALLSGVVGADNAAIALLATLGGYARGDGAYLEGGSNGMIERMCRRLENCGGTLRLHMPIERVLIENGSANGVIVGGEKIDCDAVIVTTDAMRAVDKLFDKPLQDAWIKEMRKNFSPMICSFVCLSLKKDLKGYSKMITARQKLAHMGIETDFLGFWQYSDYDYAPEGYTALSTTLIGDNYDSWRAARNEGRYEEEKEKLGEAVKRAAQQAFPEWQGLLEVVDVATPLTYERYCSSEKGSWMNYMRPGRPPARYSGLTEAAPNVYFAGQRLMEPGGMPVAVSTGRLAAQQLCKTFGKVFTAPRNEAQ